MYNVKNKYTQSYNETSDGGKNRSKNKIKFN